VRTCRLALGILVIALAMACGVSEGDFISGADHDPCESNIPVCQQTAGCAMGESKYIEGDFPGYTNFVVITPADATIVIKIFFKTREQPGVDTEIIWYEPGCNESYNYESGGEDIFAVAAGADGVFTKEQKIKIAGDHLIEIYSDALTHYFVRVELQIPHN